jgi:hypothetical protein
MVIVRRNTNFNNRTLKFARATEKGKQTHRNEMNMNADTLKAIVMEGLTEEGVVLAPPFPEPSELRLVGPRALVKSIQLVSLLVGVEQRLHERFGLDVSLMDEQAMSQSRSPFRSVESLVQYLQEVSAGRNLEAGPNIQC